MTTLYTFGPPPIEQANPDFSCVLKPQKKYKLREQRSRAEIPVNEWVAYAAHFGDLPTRPPRAFFVDMEFRWSDFGFGASVVDSIGAARAASAASRAGYIVFQMRMVAPSVYFA